MLCWLVDFILFELLRTILLVGFVVCVVLGILGVDWFGWLFLCDGEGWCSWFGLRFGC